MRLSAFKKLKVVHACNTNPILIGHQTNSIVECSYPFGGQYFHADTMLACDIFDAIAKRRRHSSIAHPNDQNLDSWLQYCEQTERFFGDVVHNINIPR